MCVRTLYWERYCCGGWEGRTSRWASITAFSLLTKDTTAFKLCPECGGFLCRQRKCSHRGPPRGASYARTSSCPGAVWLAWCDMAWYTTYMVRGRGISGWRWRGFLPFVEAWLYPLALFASRLTWCVLLVMGRFCVRASSVYFLKI